jgi:hypothetical protein
MSISADEEDILNVLREAIPALDEVRANRCSCEKFVLKRGTIR